MERGFLIINRLSPAALTDGKFGTIAEELWRVLPEVLK